MTMSIILGAPIEPVTNIHVGNSNIAPLDLNELLEPMENFVLVSPGIFRSAFPKKRNFSFLKKLKLRSILTLILEEYPTQNKTFLQDNNIKFFQFGVAGNKVRYRPLKTQICLIGGKS